MIFLVVGYVVEREGTGLAVFQPFLGGLVAAYIELPSRFGHVVEILRGVDIDAPVSIADLLYCAVSISGNIAPTSFTILGSASPAAFRMSSWVSFIGLPVPPKSVITDKAKSSMPL